jgi:hypothetical protein
MVIRRATMFSAASLKIGQPPTSTPKTGGLGPREGVIAVMLIVVVVVHSGCRDRCAHLALVGDARTHRRIFKDSHREFLHFR